MYITIKTYVNSDFHLKMLCLYCFHTDSYIKKDYIVFLKSLIECYGTDEISMFGEDDFFFTYAPQLPMAKTLLNKWNLDNF